MGADGLLPWEVSFRRAIQNWRFKEPGQPKSQVYGKQRVQLGFHGPFLHMEIEQEPELEVKPAEHMVE